MLASLQLRTRDGQQGKAYITVLGWNPTSLAGTTMDLLLSFASSLMHVKGQIELIKTNHRPEDVYAVRRQIRLLVRDTAKKLQARNDHLHSERAEDPTDAEVCHVQNKCLPPFTLCDSTTSPHSFSSGPIPLGLSILPKADQDLHYLMHKGTES